MGSRQATVRIKQEKQNVLREHTASWEPLKSAHFSPGVGCVTNHMDTEVPPERFQILICVGKDFSSVKES